MSALHLLLNESDVLRNVLYEVGTLANAQLQPNLFRLSHHGQIVPSFEVKTTIIVHANKAFFFSGKPASLKDRELFEKRRLG